MLSKFKFDIEISKFSQVVLNHQCNRACACCLVPTSGDKNFVSLELAKNCMRDLYEAGVTEQIDVIGGEPAAYPYIRELIDYVVKEVEVKKFNLLTNAFDRDFVRFVGGKMIETNGKVGMVVSINYLPETAEKLQKSNDMAAKSLDGWEALRKYGSASNGRLRVANVLTADNLHEVIEIAQRVLSMGVAINFCPMVYRRSDRSSGLPMMFRANSFAGAPMVEHRGKIEELSEKLIELKKQYPTLLVTPENYLRHLPETCKSPSEPYKINCKGFGFPYARPSYELGVSKFDGKEGMRLIACSDIKGDPENGIHSLVVSDLLIREAREQLADIYQNDPQVERCCREEGCPWSVLFSLSRINK